MTDSTGTKRTETVSVDWRLFADIAAAAGGTRRTVHVDADASIRTALRALVDEDAELADAVLADDGTVQPHLTVLQNGRRVEDLDTTVDAQDELAIMPPVSGG